MGESTYFVIPANEPHEYWTSETDPWSIYWIHFGGAKSHCFEKFFGNPIFIHSTASSRLVDRINLFNEILTSLESGFSKENIEFANLCLNALLTNKSLNVKEVAFALGYKEPLYFSRLFIKHIGKSPVTFINMTNGKTPLI